MELYNSCASFCPNGSFEGRNNAARKMPLLILRRCTGMCLFCAAAAENCSKWIRSTFDFLVFLCFWHLPRTNKVFESHLTNSRAAPRLDFPPASSFCCRSRNARNPANWRLCRGGGRRGSGDASMPGAAERARSHAANGVVQLGGVRVCGHGRHHQGQRGRRRRKGLERRRLHDRGCVRGRRWLPNRSARNRLSVPALSPMSGGQHVSSLASIAAPRRAATPCSQRMRATSLLHPDMVSRPHSHAHLLFPTKALTIAGRS